ncbi:MAG: sigma-54 dependent transcriptional regulator [Candidatus Thiodiazotropha sp.]|nr:sigma-54 dependent transcriptional regulator [Candidatus Thiodiazotropha sp.]MCM8881873.1 sigma-54 dependent transcriptional regulator [Candidatus Thiodiazotropha sp.]MCM8918540.1 sigma-54 dependent transcriptional regulator [Candidatus Thiodiazotropha sp.]
MSSLPTVLIVDDEVRGLETLQRILQDDFDVQIAENVKQATEILENEWVQIILCDQRMPDITGVEFLKQVRDQWPEVIRMIISGYTDSEDIISAVNDAGIYQFITKPWHPDSLILLLKNAAELFDLQRKNKILSIELKMSPTRLQAAMDKKRKRLRDEYQCEDQIVRSPQSCMNQVCEKIRRVSPYDVSVLLTGESGTGKELAARALHYNSTRWDQPFVVENCGALPDELLESELFGYKRGAFTGAVEDRAGLFERASGGTVFLDEIGEVSPAFQVKLLRVLQEGEIRPLGSSQTRQVDVRVIAATNRDLEQEVREGRFREDLYYRLATVTIHLPALRERKTDIPLIANSILDAAIQHLGKRVDGFSAEAIACMQAYHWPGNVRELQNEIRHMLVMSDMDEMGAELLSPRVLRAAPEGDEADLQTMGVLEGSLKERVESLEARILKETLIRHRWNKSQAAKELGLSRVGLRSKLERYGLEKVEQLRDQDERDVVG